MYKKVYSESIADLLMATLFSYRNTSVFRSILYNDKFQKSENVSVALYRLRKKGYVSHSTTGWSISKKGEKYMLGAHLLNYIPSPFKNNSPHNVVISFDIPEKNRVLRDWLRNQIKIFGYKMLQQSLWMGPGPLPTEFVKRLDDLKIRKNIKTFKVSKSRVI